MSESENNISLNSASPVALPVALITGAARRIGAETARHLHANGYRIIIHCNNSIDEANQLANSLNTQQADSAYVVCAELSSNESCKQLIDEVLSKDSAFSGRLDVLINNASAFFPTAVEAVTEEQWQTLFTTNLRAPFLLSQLAIPALKKASGAIINITDIHGNKPLSGYSVYSMTKAGLISMTHSLAKELAPEIRVNAVSPGAIMWPEADAFESEEVQASTQQKVLSKVPLARMGHPNNIAQTVLFLLENDYITGQVINVDGGRSLT